MKITIIGAGYVGLVTGTCFAETGIDVSCIDVDEVKIKNLNKGILPIYEPGLEQMIQRNVEKKQLRFSTDLKEGLEGSDVVFIAVGTPPGEDGSADLKYVLSVAGKIGRMMNDYHLIATKSTVPVGTAEKIRLSVQKELKARGEKISFDVASNPEFLKEGDAIEDFLRPDRIIIGIDSEKAEKIMNRLYKPFLLNGHPLIFMDIPSAELTKYAANSMLATKISFINDIANLCEIVGADINMVRKGIGSDSRIGNKFLYAGVGYGGSCFPKDVKALINTADEKGYSLRVLKAVDAINNDQKLIIFNKIYNYFGGNLKDKLIAVWGLSFKPNTDDMREAPSLVIIKKLLENGARLNVYDPVAREQAKKQLPDDVVYANDRYEALIDANALVVVTEWSEFRLPNYKVMNKLMREKVVFDGRNIYDAIEMKEQGFKYFGIGR
ncbi:MAG: UDP-glucose/GDP-mannose dehydrogenase family protein [Bacteroidales bacterium]|nr:UDP-glucose/GDP-mannose dehydrogenase family protein [Bacteroidales bacterium]